MRFKIVTTFLLFFISITNASPVPPPSLPAHQLSQEWNLNPYLRHFERGGLIRKDRDGYQDVVRLKSSGPRSDGFVAIFRKTSPTWKDKYESVYNKWSSRRFSLDFAEVSTNTAYIKYSNKDAYDDIAFIAVDNYVPEENLDMNPAIRLSLQLENVARINNGKRAIIKGEWKTLEEYATANPQEFQWTRRKGWCATPIFDLDDMLHDAKAAQRCYTHLECSAAESLLELHGVQSS